VQAALRVSAAARVVVTRWRLVNHKRLHRIYREAGLMIRRKKRKHCVREGKPLLGRTAANQEWALDFGA
jgi:putative transposase